MTSECFLSHLTLCFLRHLEPGLKAVIVHELDAARALAWVEERSPILLLTSAYPADNL